MPLSVQERALRGLVFAYLADKYPRAAQLLEAQAVLNDADNGTHDADGNTDGVVVAATDAIAKVFGSTATLQSVVSRRAAGKKGKATPKATPKGIALSGAAGKKPTTADSDSDDEVPPAVKRVAAAKKPTPKTSPHHAPVQARRPVPADSDSDDEPAKPLAKKASPKQAPAAAKKPVVADTDSDDEPAKPVAKKASPKQAPAAAKKPVVADTDSDDEPAKPVAKKASPKQAPAAAKKPVVADTDSDDDAPKKPAPKTASKKPAVADSDSDDEVPAKPAAKKVSPKLAPKKPAMADSDSDSDAAPKKKPSPKAAAAKAPAADDSDSDEAPKRPQFAKQQPHGAAAGKKPHHTPGERFCRINVEAVAFANDRLKDNRCREDVSGFMQNAKMLAVRGKEFNKHKQKNKAKLYAAGVDQGVHSYKFSDDD